MKYLIHTSDMTHRNGGESTGYLKLCEGNAVYIKQHRANATQFANRRVALATGQLMALRECVGVKVVAWDGNDETLVKVIKGE